MNELERIIQEGNTNTQRNERGYDYHDVTPKKVSVGIDQFWSRGNEGSVGDGIASGKMTKPELQPFTVNELDYQSERASGLAEGYKAQTEAFNPDEEPVSGLQGFVAGVKVGAEGSFIGSGIREVADTLEYRYDKINGEVDSDFVPSFDQLKGFSADEQEDLMRSHSPENYNDRVTRILDRRHYQGLAATQSQGMEIASGLIGGLVDAGPLGKAAGMTARALQGARPFVRYAASNIAPGLVANGLQAAYDPYTHPSQIVQGAILDSIPVMASPVLSKGRGYLDMNLNRALEELSKPEDLKMADTPRQAVNGWVQLGDEVKASDLASTIEANATHLKGVEDFFPNADVNELKTVSNNAVSHDALQAIIKGGRIDGDKLILDNTKINDWLGHDQVNMASFKVHDNTVLSNVNNPKMEEIASVLSREYLGGQKIILAKGSADGTLGQMTMLERGMIGIRVGQGMSLDTLIHEIGHAVVAKRLGDRRMSAATRAEFIKDMKRIADSFDQTNTSKEALHDQYLTRYGSKRDRGIDGAVNHARQEDSIFGKVYKSLTALWDKKRGDVKDQSEISAVSFQRFIKKQFDEQKVKISDDTAKALANEYATFKSTSKVSDIESKFFNEAKEVSSSSLNDVSGQQSINPDDVTSNMARGASGRLAKDDYSGTAVQAYGIVDKGDSDIQKAQANTANRITENALHNAPSRVDVSKITNPVFRKLFQIMTSDHWSVKWLSNNMMSSGLIMRMSPNPVVRQYAQLLTEDASGLGGRRVKNAAIMKANHQVFILGNIVRENEMAFNQWASRNGFDIKDRLSLKVREQFNRELSVEMNNAVQGNPVNPLFKEIIDSYSALYERINQTSGRLHSGLKLDPIKTYGFRPLKINQEALKGLDEAQRSTVKGIIVDHLVSKGIGPEHASKVTEGFLSGRVDVESIDPSMRFVSSDFDPETWTIDGSYRSVKAQEKFDRHQVTANMFSNLDVTMRIDDNLSLGDVLDNNHLNLARQYAERMSGLAGLNDVGIVHPKILDSYIEAAQRGTGEYKALPRELKAMEQVKAEIMGKRPDFADDIPFLNNLGTFMSSVQLGGASFSQAAEMANITAHYGVDAAFKMFPEVKNAIDDIRSIHKGGSLKSNSLLKGLEEESGILHGVEGYTNSTFFDQAGVNGDQALSYTSQMESVVRGAAYVNMKINGMRVLGAIQSRVTANLISDYALTAAFKGGLDAKKMSSLKDAGFDEGLLSRIKSEAKYKIDGDSIDMDWSSLSKETLEDFNVAVTRGTKQVIQGDLVGERGAWVHSSLWRAALLYRRFPIVAIEKQMIRQGERGNVFMAAALAQSFALGSVFYASRVYLNSIGREDAEEYRKKMLDPETMPLMVMNYMGQFGMLPDIGNTVKDAFWGDEYGRSGLVGNSFAPGVGFANDTFKALQLPKMLIEGDNEKAMKTVRRILPLGRVPGVVQGLNFIQGSLDNSDD
nr:MAG TPA: zinc metalloprotease [Caudoviricetes sp.]